MPPATGFRVAIQVLRDCYEAESYLQRPGSLSRSHESENPPLFGRKGVLESDAARGNSNGGRSKAGEAIMLCTLRPAIFSGSKVNILEVAPPYQ